MKCHICGYEIPDGMRFCSRCGSAVSMGAGQRPGQPFSQMPPQQPQQQVPPVQQVPPSQQVPPPVQQVPPSQSVPPQPQPAEQSQAKKPPVVPIMIAVIAVLAIAVTLLLIFFVFNGKDDGGSAGQPNDNPVTQADEGTDADKQADSGSGQDASDKGSDSGSGDASQTVDANNVDRIIENFGDDIDAYNPADLITSLGEYEGVEVDCTVSDADVQEEIDYLLMMNDGKKFNDAFVKKYTDYDSVEEFKTETREKLAAEKLESVGYTALQTVIDNTTFSDIPEAMLKAYGDRMIADRTYSAEDTFGQSIEEYADDIGWTMEEFEKAMMEYGELDCKMILVVELISAMEGYLDVADTYLYNAKNESDSSYEIGKQEYEKENGTSICFDRYEWDTYLYDKVKELLESKAVVKQ